MNRLRELSSQVMDVYQSLSQEFSAYQSSQSLNCVEKCGACCNKPDIEVSPLEMLPYALHLFDSGQAEQVFDELQSYSGFACKQYQRLSLDGTEGYCGIYEYRPGICRMFGAAGYKTKSGEATLSVCKPIKQAVPEKYAAALIAIQPAWGQSHDSDPMSTMSISSSKPPMIAEGRQKLAQLDYELGDKLMPINDALHYILEKILTLMFYSQNIDDGVAA
ncbi:YkgJ family cysteine cluster protein [Alteromonas sp. BL110]|uniref:YkgJ family cysteine cluster protein n=1 Tax=Alteromonas sp. BL110 TaxID=1714845 RepID=UPI000E505BD1|nr:YkgJ family cysteine cluster protein [Alteromonas sp. BL110]AXT39030.1 YkgJ family cysteine cluster protein [Alteromonas sp. BL110]RKM84363.1 YkgJ family cysteine cluster protein [Alteromonas sp. BL110]